MADDKQFKPSARRIQESRNKGNVPRSRELAPALAFLSVATAAGAASLSTWTQGMVELERHLYLAGQVDYDVAQVGRLLGQNAIAWSPAFLVLVGAAAAASAVAVAVEGGPAPTVEPFKLDPSRFDPISKVKNLFSLRHVWEVVRALVAATLTITIALWTAKKDLALLPGFLFEGPATVGRHLGQVLLDISWRIGLGLVVLAVVDYAISRWLFTRDLMMTREEMQTEHKEQEGSPEVKSQRRRQALNLVKSGSIADVRKADVVVTNPTHFAVALSYKRAAMTAPIVLVKGRNKRALEIRAEASRWGVPVVENPPLARELYRSAEVSQEIPAEMFQAVAEVIAFVMKLRMGLGNAEQGARR